MIEVHDKGERRMAQINIVMVFDAQAVLSAGSPSSSPTQPTGLAHPPSPPYFAYMITEQQYLEQPVQNAGHATPNLIINATVGDTVNWYAVTLSGDQPTYCIPYNIVQFSGSTVMTTPVGLTAQPTEPVPPPQQSTTNPTWTSTQQYQYFMTSNVVSPGTEGYQVWFQVVQMGTSGSLSTLGYYYWDPTVQVLG